MPLPRTASLFLARPLSAAFTLCALLLTGHPSIAARPTPIHFRTIHMFTPRVGWGTTVKAIVRTVDGGRTWTNVTPPLPPHGDTGLNAQALDADSPTSAWFAADNDTGTQEPTLAVIYHTANSGASWQRLTTLHLGRYYYVWRLTFVDATHGWLAVMRGVAMSQITFDLFRTASGGRSWTPIIREGSGYAARATTPAPLPWCDGCVDLTFTSPRLLWNTGCYCGLGPDRLLFYRSSDGGATWHPRTLATPPGFRAGAPQVGHPAFFSPREAVLPVYLFTHARKASSPAGTWFDLYHSSDGGETWRPTTPLRVATTGLQSAVVDRTRAFVLSGHTLFATSDGGHAWHAVNTHLGPWQLDGVTSVVLFALVPLRNTADSSLSVSHDGGHTWHTIPARLDR